MNYRNQVLKQVTTGKYSKKTYLDLIKKRSSYNSNTADETANTADETELEPDVPSVCVDPVVITNDTNILSEISALSERLTVLEDLVAEIRHEIENLKKKN